MQTTSDGASAASRASSVHCTEPGVVARNVARWVWAVIARGSGGRPVSLLDNTPLRELVRGVVDFSAVRGAIRNGHLDALCVTASSYDRGRSVSFFEGTTSCDHGAGPAGSAFARRWARSTYSARRFRLGPYGCRFALRLSTILRERVIVSRRAQGSAVAPWALERISVSRRNVSRVIVLSSQRRFCV